MILKRKQFIPSSFLLLTSLLKGSGAISLGQRIAKLFDTPTWHWSTISPTFVLNFTQGPPHRVTSEQIVLRSCTLSILKKGGPSTNPRNKIPFGNEIKRLRIQFLLIDRWIKCLTSQCRP
mmetsp:Transcript_17224/g.35828  ORF Transcript_17224/g.35828 Transcript_17224/m.35828 type:complete len:120 (+) Transcript_17224:80-439(+)